MGLLWMEDDGLAMIGFAGVLEGLVDVSMRLGEKEPCSWTRSSMSWISSSFSVVWPLRMLRRYFESLKSWLTWYRCGRRIA